MKQNIIRDEVSTSIERFYSLEFESYRYELSAKQFKALRSDKLVEPDLLCLTLTKPESFFVGYKRGYMVNGKFMVLDERDLTLLERLDIGYQRCDRPQYYRTNEVWVETNQGDNHSQILYTDTRIMGMMRTEVINNKYLFIKF